MRHITKRRPRTEVNKKTYGASFTYKVGESKIKVCKKAFLSLYGIKDVRLKRIQDDYWNSPQR